MGQWKSLKIDSGTGWKSIYRDTGTGWKALEWEGVPIDVGGTCTDRPTYRTMIGYTWIEKNNAANANGTITNVCIYAHTVLANDWYVGIFYLVSGTTYKCRSAANVGEQSVGANNNVVSLAIQTGDLIGIYALTGNNVERTIIGDGAYYIPGNKCVVDNESVYTDSFNSTFSAYGTG